LKFKSLFIALVVSIAVLGPASARNELEENPYGTSAGPDIDLYLSSWQESMPYNTHGSLIERDIFTRCSGDVMNPTARGAVLKYINRFTHATLYGHNSTSPSVLKREQEIYFVLSGKGTLKAGKKNAELYEGVTVLMPPGIEFTMADTGDEPLTMYLISEPIPEGFAAKKEMVVKDENELPISDSTGHWCHIFRRIFAKEDGMATILQLGTVMFDPMTIGQPHSHDAGIEEIWVAVHGDITCMLGKNLRKLPPGTAFMIPPDGKTPHSTINMSDKTVKLLYFGVYK
jgi:mannose-6-phosphate isomerase-like protein (cupin superfamily)